MINSWRAGSHGLGKRHWFVVRRPWEALRSKNGNIRWFATYETAERAANAANLNEEDFITGQEEILTDTQEGDDD